MIHKQTLRYSLYAAAIAITLALTAVFGKFDQRLVVANINLSYVLLAVIIGGAGYVTAGLVREQGTTAIIINGVVGSMITGLALAGLALIEASSNITFVFPNLTTDPNVPILTFGQELGVGLILLLIFSFVTGVISALIHMLPDKIRRVLLLALSITAVVGLLEAQINRVITLPDALALAAVFTATYIIGGRLTSSQIVPRLTVGAGVGAVAGLVLALIANGGGLDAGGILRGSADIPRILNSGLPSLVVVFAIIGAVGALITSASSVLHGGAIYVVAILLLLGVLNWQVTMTYLAALLSLLLLGALFWFIPSLNGSSEVRFETLTRGQQVTTQRIGAGVGLLVMLIAPLFMGQYITSILDLVGLYVIMGIGLNIVVGYAGLLDLGYVAFFALGAYAIGILTTPSLLTCGGVHPSDIPVGDIPAICTGVMTFWQAWPLAILVAGIAGVMLGIPVLRLRGDYLAIVTLGFGEIIRLLALSNDLKPLLGAAQGVTNIPSPIINLTMLNPAWRFDLGNATTVYYVILGGVLITAFIALRLGGTRLGRAWRAMRADEDVAQAMGVNLVRTKLLAFAIGAAFAGMGGAIFGSWLKGIFPNSFTLLVSINVLSLIIIGGLGSIPGVVVGSLMLLGLPEILRELQDYRLLVFGVLLVVTMLVKPEGLIPPPVRRLSEMAAEYRAKKEA